MASLYFPKIPPSWMMPSLLDHNSEPGERVSNRENHSYLTFVPIPGDIRYISKASRSRLEDSTMHSGLIYFSGWGFARINLLGFVVLLKLLCNLLI